MIRGAWGRDPLLPRAFSLMAVGPGGTADILAKTVGRGTALLERALPGAEVDVLGPLGSTFPAPRADTTDLLVAGGVGLPPLYMQGALAAAGAPRGALRARSTAGAGAPDLVLLPEMEAMGLALFLTTEDGAVGTKGLVTRALEARLERHKGTPVRVMGCGPNAMLWAVARLAARARRSLLHLARGADGVRHRRLPGLRDPRALAPLPLRLQQRTGVRGGRRARRSRGRGSDGCALSLRRSARRERPPPRR